MNKKLLLLILMVFSLFISSCSDDDGKVDPMKWKTEAKKSSDGYFHVSPEGGTFVLQCTNYSDFWITGITEQEAKGEEKNFTPPYDDLKHFTITADWTTATQKWKYVDYYYFADNIGCQPLHKSVRTKW